MNMHSIVILYTSKNVFSVNRQIQITNETNYN